MKLFFFFYRLSLRGFNRRNLLPELCLFLLLLNSCTSQKTPTYNEIVYSKGSMTKSLKSLNNDLSIQILKTGVQGNNYVRITALKLHKQPVIAAISQTNIYNKTFVSILANADTSSIGAKLFSPDSPIKRRDSMSITQIHLNDIKNPVIVNYLTDIGYTESQVITKRQSQFYYHKETMNLIEYILPTLNQFIK